jgi:hypothetical protein
MQSALARQRVNDEKKKDSIVARFLYLKRPSEFKLIKVTTKYQSDGTKELNLRN